jgi:hypothetical protein
VTAPFPSPRWTPIRVENDRVRWCHTEGVVFDEPFFNDTVERCLRHPFRLLFQPTTSVDELDTYAARAPQVPAGGLVLHQSRCGSTLVAQMLAAVPGHRVLSEAPPLDDVLRSGNASAFSAMAAALAQAEPHPRRAFFKLDAWSTMQLTSIRASMPAVPWIFLYRDPLALLESHARRFGGHTVPGAIAPDVFGLDAGEVATLTPIDYAARVLARIGEAALAHRDDPGGRFVHYRELPEFVTEVLPDLWGFEVDDAARAAMHAVAGRDAKNPAIPFDPHRPVLRANEQAAVQAAAEKWLDPVYAALEDVPR